MSKKLDSCSFEHNFREYCPTLIFFDCCRQKLSVHRHVIEFVTSPIVCCCITSIAAAKQLLRTGNNFSQSVVVSVGVSKLGCTELFFVEPGTKINNAYFVMCVHSTCTPHTCNNDALRNARRYCAQYVASKQPRSKSCGLGDLGCHAASCLRETFP